MTSASTKPSTDASGAVSPPNITGPPRRRPPGRLLRRYGVKIGAPIAGLVILGLAWQAAVAVFDVPDYILPPPTEFLPAIATSWEILWPATVVTGEEILYGFLIGAVISVPLAMLLCSIEWLREALYPLIVFLQVIPKIAVAPLFIIWFGADKKSVVLLTFILCFFPIMVNAMAGFSEMDPRRLYLAQCMGATPWQTFRYVRLKSAMPYIFAGFRIAITLAASGAIVGEFVGSNSGLGYVLQAATGVLNMPLIFADLVMLSLLGLVANYVVVGLEWLVMPWRRGAQ